MLILSDSDIQQIIQEINESAEKNRRALSKRRHDIYKDGGKAFLIEQIRREFGDDALKEMRLAPVNLLKKIVNRRSSIYKKSPVRRATNSSDQPLVDFYTEKLSINTLMQKANKYYTLFSNCALYCRPVDGLPRSCVVPSYLYSVKADPNDLTKIQSFVFNAFKDNVTPVQGAPSYSGNESFSLEKGFKTLNDKVSSGEIETDPLRKQYLFWTGAQHILVDLSKENYQILTLPEDQVNPIGILPVVNIAKDRDNESWATQGEDMIDLTIAIQLGWTDLLTIAKHQGFSLLTLISQNEPKKLTMGINKAIWLKAEREGPAPSLNYVTGNSPLSEYKELLMELLGLLLTTNDMDPGAISGKGQAQNFTSGFHALIAMSDNLEAVENDKPTMLSAEKEHWEIIKRWHNFMYDANVLDESARSLGRFNDDFSLSIQFADIKPLESEDEVLDRIIKMRNEGLITREQALKKLHPDYTDDQIQELIQKIDDELNDVRVKMIQDMGENEPEA